jgi:hypothetical protein
VTHTVMFYYSTRDQYDLVEEVIQSYQHHKYLSGAYKNRSFTGWHYDIFKNHGAPNCSIPKSLPGKKKYTGAFQLLREISIHDLPFDIYAELQLIGVEVYTPENLPARTRPKATELKIIFQTLGQFISFSRELDKLFGHGGWSVKQTSVHRKLRETEIILGLEKYAPLFRPRRREKFKEATVRQIKCQGGLELTLFIPATAETNHVLKTLFMCRLKADE